MELLNAGLPDVQVSDEVSVQVTWSPFRGMYEYVERFAPTGIPFTFHCYEGEEPSLPGYAVNKTVIPEQTGFCEAPTETLTGSIGFTIIRTRLLVAGLLKVQIEFEEVS